MLYGQREGLSPATGHTRVLTEMVWSDFQKGKIGSVVQALPGLIQTAQALEERDDVHERWAISARVHHLAASTLSKIGEGDLAWLAAERAMYAADQADDPLVLASAARAGTHALLAAGRYVDALDLGSTAAEWLRRQMREDDPNAVSLLGMLHLRTGVAAARHDDRSTATDNLGRAEALAAQLGEDGNYWQTAFGPTNVELHRLSAALDLGDVVYVVERAPQVDCRLDAGRASPSTEHLDAAEGARDPSPCDPLGPGAGHGEPRRRRAGDGANRSGWPPLEGHDARAGPRGPQRLRPAPARCAYVTLALLVGVRNEELRAVTWDHVDLDGNPGAVPSVPPSIRVWRSVRAGGDTKTRLSRRTIGLPAQCVEILEKHRSQMAGQGLDVEHGLVFCTSTGTALDSANVRRSFRALCKEAGLDSSEWTPREMRHSFVSLMSEAGVPLEAIARVVGHSSTKVTELVYRKQLRPVLTEGTAIMETLFELPAVDRKRSPDG